MSDQPKPDLGVVAIEEAPASADAPKPVVRRVIEVGDGRNPEVFEADDLETLVDKLCEGKGHASKHIIRLEAAIRELRAKFANYDVHTFIESHDDYANDGAAGEKNGELMRMKLADLRLPATSENLHKAYQALKESRLLAPKEPVRTEQPSTDVAPRGRRVSTISSHSRATAVPVSTEPSESELYEMPLPRLRELSNKQLRSVS